MLNWESIHRARYSPMFKIEGLQHIALHVADVGRSSRFYQRVLGLEPIPRPDFPFEGAWFQLGPEQQLHLIAGRERPVAAGSRSNHFALMVNALQKVVEQLEDEGLEYKGPKQNAGGVWQVFISDPDGYCIEFFENPWQPTNTTGPAD